MLTKKDFIKVAEILRETLKNCKTEEEEVLINFSFCRFIDWFKDENPNFNEDKFREAVLKE
jgi:hypothetical protein